MIWVRSQWALREGKQNQVHIKIPLTPTFGLHAFWTPFRSFLQISVNGDKVLKLLPQCLPEEDLAWKSTLFM